MRRALQSLTDAREELVRIERDFTQLQERIEAVRDSVADSLVRLFGEDLPAFTGLKEEELIDRIAGRVVAHLASTPGTQPQSGKRYVRDNEAAAFLGVSVSMLRSWRSRGNPAGPPVTRVSGMVMYSLSELERYMEERTVGKR